jgi:hypothetical protein
MIDPMLAYVLAGMTAVAVLAPLALAIWLDYIKPRR